MDVEIVGEASNGEAAVKLAHRIHPDVVLMDISMPVMNGIEATRVLHAEMPEIKVIGLSMFEEAERADAMRRSRRRGLSGQERPVRRPDRPPFGSIVREFKKTLAQAATFAASKASRGPLGAASSQARGGGILCAYSRRTSRARAPIKSGS